MTDIQNTENNAKHTPAPWVADLGETYSVRASDGRVAYCQHVHLTGRRDAATVAANARLIAAAPHMFDVLEASAADPAGMTNWSDEQIRGWAYATARNARRAIAKARGQQ